MTIERLHGLSAFVRAVEAGSFTGAAKMLGTSPSAVSKSVARLEARLGAKLVHRSTRSFELTEEGRAYHGRIAQLLRELEEATEVLTAPSVAAGTLRVSMPSDLGRTLLPAITSRLMPRHPKLKLDVGLSDQYVDLVRDGFDVALRVGHVVEGGLFARPLTELPLVLVASPDYLARFGIPVTVSDLAQHCHVRYMLARQVTPLMFADGNYFPSDGSFDSDSGEAMRIAAVRGLGVAQMLKAAVQADLDAGRLRLVLPDVPLLAVPVRAVHAFGRRLPMRARVFLDFIAAELVASAL
ncbi:LysR family transcriptional regulator [Burkholderia lata]|uniref:LysR family transcriptional regulator n=1 Tax=Burkholderia lata (strain ATCC 17760 / DSM 23089 / LMG 22485 / NCIMB 9086 / R18194 / 383) TaxID=482957 RepID=UPI00399A4B96